MKRRDWLKLAAAGAASLALPVTGRLRAEGRACPRFLFVVEGNGFEPASVLCDEARAVLDTELSSPVMGSRWWYRSYRHDTPLDIPTPGLATSDYLMSQYGTPFPLEPLAEQGLVSKSTVVLGLSSRIVGGGHSGQHGALCSARTIGGRPGGISIDAHLAALPDVRRTTPFDALRLGVGGSSSIDFGTCAYGYARPAPVVRDVGDAYAFAYGAFADGAARADFERRDRMLRFAAEDLAAAEAVFTGNPAELAKLGTYGDSIAALIESQDRLRALDVTAPPPIEAGLSPLPRFEALCDLAASALIDGLTSVAVVTSGTGGGFSLTYSSISSTGRHDMQHTSGGDPVMLDAIRQVNRAQVSAIARAAKRLEDAGILDETIVVWVGDNGEQHHSTSSEFPVLLIGGGALGMRDGGRTVVYPGVGSPANRQLSNLWNTLGYAAGDTLDEFGGETGDLRMAPGPLAELIG